MVLTKHNALPVARAAEVLNVSDAIPTCLKYIMTQLNASNCVHYLVHSRDIEALHKFVIKYAIEHFGEIIQHDSFDLLGANDLSDFLRNDNLTIDSEEILFHALTKWYKQDPNNRQSAIKDMLPLIRYGDFSREVCMQSNESINQ